MPAADVRGLRPSIASVRENARGHVALVGAGPGDAELWTVRGTRLVRDADVVLYDALVDVDALRRTTRARLVLVGKRGGRPSARQDAIERLMIREARQGHRVVRLKGGDPFVFGRGGEEVLALAQAGVAVEVVPGVTTAVAAPAAAGIPVTHRGLASGFLVVTGHDSATIEDALSDVRSRSLTLVVLMGLGGRGEVAGRLIAKGWPETTPAALVTGAFTTSQWSWAGRLADVHAAQPPHGAAGVLVIGDVVQVPELVAQAMAGRRAGS
jgi:uroporphyrin-III C-methyltransferase